MFKPGQTTDLNWGNIKGSTVTLTLRSGANGDLDKGTVIKGEHRPTFSAPRPLQACQRVRCMGRHCERPT